MVKFVCVESEPMLPPASCAMARTRDVELVVSGSTQANVPVLPSPVAMLVGNVAPPSVESARSTPVTPTLSVAVHVMLWLLPTFQISPPAGDVSVTTGAWLSTGVTANDAAIVWFAEMFRKLYVVTAPTDTPFTSTSCTWKPLLGVMV